MHPQTSPRCPFPFSKLSQLKTWLCLEVNPCLHETLVTPETKPICVLKYFQKEVVVENFHLNFQSLKSELYTFWGGQSAPRARQGSEQPFSSSFLFEPHFYLFFLLIKWATWEKTASRWSCRRFGSMSRSEIKLSSKKTFKDEQLSKLSLYVIGATWGASHGAAAGVAFTGF